VPLWQQKPSTVFQLIVLLTNNERRAIHDFIAETVVVQKEFLPKE
jgi:hypothetical protein